MTFKLQNLLPIVFLFLITNILFSQTEFEKGEFITNADETVECLIKNIDWKNNPTEFKYKLSENSEIKTGSIEKVKVFEVYGTSKYLRATVDIDRSAGSINHLTDNRNPIFKNEELFLKVIVAGNATLYKYEDSNLLRFFYSIENQKIEQLVYKEYLYDSGNIAENSQYKQQILNTLKCENINVKTVENLNYKIKDLTVFFENYNVCNGRTSLVNYQKKDKKDLFNFRVKMGFGLASLSTRNELSTSRNTDFENEFIYRFGGELEMILPFNNDKWAFLIEPSYQSYSSEKGSEAKVNYSTFEFPFGARHYFFLNDHSKIFVNAYFTLIYAINSQIEFKSGSELDINKAAGQSIGAGYSYKKLSMECRYEFSRDILDASYAYWYSDYDQVSLIFGYQLF